ncbi:hypothetical protein LUZ60_006160 [Juncus effusus]|nr:hypothetical protein LUZ60_006160 [Juncus effusus]
MYAETGNRSSNALPPAAKPYPAMPHSDPMYQSPHSMTEEYDHSNRLSSSSNIPGYSSVSEYTSSASGECSPYAMSPWNQTTASPWAYHHDEDAGDGSTTPGMGGTTLLGSLVREEGHIYSLAAVGDLLYTGSDSKNIRVWKKQQDLVGFKSSSGLVKSIVIVGERIFTGHQDGKIRVWRVSPKNPTQHKRVGSLPRLRDILRSSLNPSNYVEIKRHKSSLWIKHCDAISCLGPTEDGSLLYSGSWDKTFKIWRISDSKCLESVVAHDDAVNAVVAAFNSLVFTGSADGTVKVWKRELQGKGTKHTPVQTLLKQESAITALAVSPTAPIVYCGSSDGMINLWEGERHLAHGGVLQGHKMAVLCLAAAGTLLLSGSADKTIFVWRREGGFHSCLSVLTGHTGPVKCLAIVPDTDEESGNSGGLARWIVYSGSLDKSVKVWRVSEDSPDALLRGPQQVPIDAAYNNGAISSGYGM